MNWFATFSDGLRVAYTDRSYALRVAHTFVTGSEGRSVTFRDRKGHVTLVVREDGTEWSPPVSRAGRKISTLTPAPAIDVASMRRSLGLSAVPREALSACAPTRIGADGSVQQQSSASVSGRSFARTTAAALDDLAEGRTAMADAFLRAARSGQLAAVRVG